MRLRVLGTRVGRVLQDDRGGVTAEFAVTLPVTAAVIALCVGSVALAGQQLRLTSAAADLARSEARGETLTSSPERTLGFPVGITRTSVNGLHCVHLSATPGGGVLAALRISARGCALRSDGGTA